MTNEEFETLVSRLDRAAGAKLILLVGVFLWVVVTALWATTTASAASCAGPGVRG